MASQFCTTCGAQLQPGAKFCLGCGAPAPQGMAPMQQPPQPAAAVPLPPAGPPPQYAPPPVLQPAQMQPAPPPPPPEKVKPGAGTYFGYLLLTGIPGVGLIFALVLGLGKKPGHLQNFARAMIAYNAVISGVIGYLVYMLFQFLGKLAELGYAVTISPS